MSLQEMALLVAILVGVITIFRAALEIKANPEHRSAILKCLNVARRFAPLALMAFAYSINSPNLVFLSLVLETLNLIIAEDPYPKRSETAVYVLFVVMCFAVVQTLALRTIADEMAPRAPKPAQKQDIGEPLAR